METVILNPLEHPQFTITRSLLGQLHIDCPGNPPLLLHPTVKTIPVIVSTNVCSGRIIRDEPFYIVEINVNVSSAIDNGLKAHDLMIIYMAFVHIDDTSFYEDSIHHILNDVIPKSKFNDINTIIFNATNATGYPVTLNKEKFNESISDNGTTEWDDSMDSYESIDLYMQTIKNVMS